VSADSKPGRDKRPFAGVDAAYAIVRCTPTFVTQRALGRWVGLRVGRGGLHLREPADQLGHAGRLIVKGVVKG
jgi:hypothetical protein